MSNHEKSRTVVLEIWDEVVGAWNQFEDFATVVGAEQAMEERNEIAKSEYRAESYRIIESDIWVYGPKGYS